MSLEFRIAASFTAALARLAAQEQKAAKQAERFLRKRKAKPEEFAELRAKQEAEIRRLKEEFAAKLRALLDTI